MALTVLVGFDTIVLVTYYAKRTLYESLDWSLSNHELAERHGLKYRNVLRWRYALGEPPSIFANMRRPQFTPLANKVRELASQGMSQVQIAAKLNVTRQAVNQVIHRDRTDARKAVQDAIKRNRLVRPDRCERCHMKPSEHAHHPNYEQRLSVVWLCRKCHAEIHNRKRV